MRTFLLSFSLIGISLLLAGCNRLPGSAATPTPEANFEIQKDSKLAGQNGTPVPQNEGSQEGAEKGGMAAAKQVDFVSEATAQSFVANGPTVYFFKADWCPTCKQAQADLDKNISNLPAGTTIVTVNYDKESALKKKYNITYQHTFVQIDQNGNEVAKWQGGGVEAIASNIK